MTRALILEQFAKSLHLEITKDTVTSVRNIVQRYELRDQHMYALNTAYLGLHDIFFYDTDKARLYDLFDYTGDDIKTAIEPLTVNNNPINPSWSVTSEPFNLFCVWVIHKTFNSKLSRKDKEELSVTLFKYLHYSYFSSLVNHRFRHKPNEAVMRATIESLSGKPGIVQHGTWRKLIEYRCNHMLSERNYQNALKRFGPDKMVLRVVADSQTGLRNMINTITKKFYDMVDEKRTIETYGTVATIDGEKILRDTTGTLDQIATRVGNDIYSANDFIDGGHIKLLCGLNKELKPTMFRQLLNRYVDLASFQAKKGNMDDEATIKGESYYVGYHILVVKIIEHTYHYLVDNKVKMNNKIEILKSTQDAYRASQLADPDLLKIKRSVSLFIDGFPGTTRGNTKSILRSNFIAYVILLSFKYL